MSPSRTGLRVVAWPDAGMQCVNRLAVIQRMAGDKLAQRRCIYVAGGQCVIQTAPPAPMHRRQAQVRQGWHKASHYGSVQQLEQRVAPRTKAFVHPGAEPPE